MTRLRLAATIGAAALCSLAFVAPAMGATFHVNDFGDTADSDIGNGFCDTDLVQDDTPCTLRAAISEANFTSDPDDIVFDVTGTHTIDSTLSILQPLTITGNGSGVAGTVVDGDDEVNLFTSNNSTVTLRDIRLEDGSREQGGAAVEFAGDGTLDNVTATSNETVGAGFAYGGAISSTSSTATLTITDSTISDNTMSGSNTNIGAGVGVGGPLVMTDTTVTGNSMSDAPSLQGGGIYADGPVDIESSAITDNSGAIEGGGIYVDSNTAGARTVTNSTFSGNDAGGGGGGGLFAKQPTTIDGSTFASNSSTGVGGDDVAAQNVAVTIQRTILGSSTVDGCATVGGGSLTSGGSNIDIGTTCGFGTADGNQENTDADLGPLQVNSPGTTATHDIAANGPAMNTAGDCASALPTDQRGVERPQGEACDVGAFELEHQTLSVTRVGSGTVTGTGINCPTDCGEAEPIGTQITLTPTPEAGFTFTGWSGDCTGTGACVVTLSEDRAVTATFTSNKNVSVSTAGTGSGSVTGTQVACPGDCAGSYIHGTVLVLTAAANAGSTFTSWSGCDSTAGAQCTLNMTSDRLVTATFTADPVTPPPGGGPTPTPKKCKKGFVKKKGKCVKKKKRKKK